MAETAPDTPTSGKAKRKAPAKRKGRRKMGRPKGTIVIDPNDHIGPICEWIAKGMTLRDYCRQPGSPSFWLVYQWLAADKDFASRFAQARNVGEDIIAQECLEIADDATNDFMVREKDDGSTEVVLDRENVQRSKLRIWTRLQLLARWNPRRYGDKVEVENKGGITVKVVTGVPRAPNEPGADDVSG